MGPADRDLGVLRLEAVRAGAPGVEQGDLLAGFHSQVGGRAFRRSAPRPAPGELPADTVGVHTGSSTGRVLTKTSNSLTVGTFSCAGIVSFTSDSLHRLLPASP